MPLLEGRRANESPELGIGERNSRWMKAVAPSSAADIYSLGVVLAEACAPKHASLMGRARALEALRRTGACMCARLPSMSPVYVSGICR